ncbi:AraC family transcriptional regulator, partial [Pseudotabrizicola sp. 4114]|uniref:AraC family transcriptional regulator n=1 Tax=Pseudotabrizicola sp. 4114 TaxID=2817731 RepID=UPI0032B7E115
HDLTLRDPGRHMRLMHNSARLHQLQLHFIAYKTDASGVDVRAPKLENSLLVKIPLSGTAEISQGSDVRQVRAGMIYIAEPRKPLQSSMSSDYQQLTLQIPMSVLLHAASTELQNQCPESLHFDFEAVNCAPAARLFLGTLGSICHALEMGDGLLDQPMVQRSCQMTLLSLLLSLPNSLSDRLGRGQHSAVPYYIRRAEEFMRTHLTDDIGIDDLVHIAGVSRRSLHAGFRRFRDTTPLGLHKMMRLEAARADILKASETSRTVTDIATTYGFYHLSKFARDFRATFGALPSEMMRSANR